MPHWCRCDLQPLEEVVPLVVDQNEGREALDLDPPDGLHPELGMEAVWRIEVKGFPAFILVDDKGNDFFQGL